MPTAQEIIANLRAKPRLKPKPELGEGVFLKAPSVRTLLRIDDGSDAAGLAYVCECVVDANGNTIFNEETAKDLPADLFKEISIEAASMVNGPDQAKKN